MTNIKLAREIITDIHKSFPDGIRKAVRSELNKSINIPQPDSTNLTPENPKFWAFIADFIGAICNQKENTGRIFEDYYSISNLRNYYSTVLDKEMGIINRKTQKQLDFKILSRNNKNVSNGIIFNICQGLLAVKKAGLKLPEYICVASIKKKKDRIVNGYFLPRLPDRIFVNENCREIAHVVIHESIHKNDSLAHKFFKIPFCKKILSICNFKTIKFDKEFIKEQLYEYAAKDRDELIACSATELIYRNLKWSDLHPKIEELYKKLKGPDLNLA